MNDVIQRIYESGYVEDADGQSYPHDTSSVSFEAGMLLYDFVRSVKPRRTLEIGLAYGISALFICQAHKDNGGGHHTALDPYEHRSYGSIGVLNIERANLNEQFSFHDTSSEEALPEMYMRGEQFDFAFIDGNHHFDHALVDFFYIDKMMRPGDYVAIDDLWMPGVRKMASFVHHNKPYTLAPPPTTQATPAMRRVLRAGRRIAQNPLGRDWPLKLVPHNIAFFLKTDPDDRAWDFHRTF